MAHLTRNRFIGLATALVMALGAQPATAAADAPGPSATAVLFALSLRGVTNGRPFALAGLQGRPLLVNFWARWCLPCRREIPELVAVHARYRSGGLEVVGIAVEDAESREGVRDFAKAYELSYTSLIGGLQPGIELMRALGNQKAGLPFTIAIDRTGTIRSSKLGAMTQTEMEAAVRLVL
ncbi:TlpA disulfide reductase family protein [Accumulibacter sp.]|uniref:TlpA family protein disulfide reductase n=1 Tax=Accumulibacter sp. TaxID=2053492 RepID=UPI0026017A7E|nr:TlpA disulfide reductase family protein [Accumulibacter sp.]